MPIAAMREGSMPASAPETADATDAHMASASCSTRPGAGKRIGTSAVRTATTRLSWSRSSAVVPVVP
jgi:hypothetical protein